MKTYKAQLKEEKSYSNMSSKTQRLFWGILCLGSVGFLNSLFLLHGSCSDTAYSSLPMVESFYPNASSWSRSTGRNLRSRNTSSNSLPSEEPRNTSKSSLPSEEPRNTSNSSLPSEEPLELSACMLIMDDNHFLIEWIAYHYHTANLRHLTITSDPRSKTSPSKILDRWKDRINIQEWKDEDFLYSDFAQEVKDKAGDDPKKKEVATHRVRQASFNLRCMQDFKKKSLGWTLLLDSDEYLATNEHRFANENNKTVPSVPDVLRSMHIPSGFEGVYSPCLAINRKQFSAVESPEDVVQSMAAQGFNALDFQTLRWRKTGVKPKWHKTKFGKSCDVSNKFRTLPNKVMVDLNRLTLKELRRSSHSGNPHNPLEFCPDAFAHRSKKDENHGTPFVLNHYAGTLEQYAYRDDSRGMGYRKSRYDEINNAIGAIETDFVRPWLKEFVASVGNTEALRLLKDVGKLEALPVENVENKENAEKKEEPQDVASAPSSSQYKVGDIVEANYQGDDKWFKAEIFEVYPDEHYSVLYQDCVLESSFAQRIRTISSNTVKTENTAKDEGDNNKNVR